MLLPLLRSLSTHSLHYHLSVKLTQQLWLLQSIISLVFFAKESMLYACYYKLSLFQILLLLLKHTSAINSLIPMHLNIKSQPYSGHTKNVLANRHGKISVSSFKNLFLQELIIYNSHWSSG